ncbi:hypothetical protein J2S89_000512 [Arthrobacter bambusae]|nr:hypothetical protein [Arthrobacter bambusae]MDQ0096502.1 hypothetical protein [Arthrobacter bambusae]
MPEVLTVDSAANDSGVIDTGDGILLGAGLMVTASYGPPPQAVSGALLRELVNLEIIPGGPAGPGAKAPGLCPSCRKESGPPKSP